MITLISGHGKFEPYVEAGEVEAEIEEVTLLDQKGLVGDILCGVNGHDTRYEKHHNFGPDCRFSQDRLVYRIVKHLHEGNKLTMFTFIFDNCRAHTRRGAERVQRIHVRRDREQYKLGEVT